MPRENLTVVARAPDYKYQETRARIIAQLEGETARELLHVAQAHLALRECQPVRARHQSIPGAQVALDRERNLDTEAQSGSENPFEVRLQSELGCVAHWRTGRVQAEAGDEAERARGPGQMLKRDMGEAAALKAPVCRPRQAGAPADRRLAQARTQPRGAEFPLGGGQKVAGVPEADVAWIFTNAHRRSLAHGTYRRLTWGCPRERGDETNDRPLGGRSDGRLCGCARPVSGMAVREPPTRRSCAPVGQRAAPRVAVPAGRPPARMAWCRAARRAATGRSAKATSATGAAGRDGTRRGARIGPPPPDPTNGRPARSPRPGRPRPRSPPRRGRSRRPSVAGAPA